MPAWLVAALLVVLANLAAPGPAAAVRTEPRGGGRSPQAINVNSQTLGTLKNNLALRATTPTTPTTPRPPKNTRPLIGILSQPKYWRGPPDAAGGYIAASYVKYLEAAGARAVPISFNAPTAGALHGCWLIVYWCTRTHSLQPPP